VFAPLLLLGGTLELDEPEDPEPLEEPEEPLEEPEEEDPPVDVEPEPLLEVGLLEEPELEEPVVGGASVTDALDAL
jgi:hypothetical protein